MESPRDLHKEHTVAATGELQGDLLARAKLRRVPVGGGEKEKVDRLHGQDSGFSATARIM
jgi:hypothetical protein